MWLQAWPEDGIQNQHNVIEIFRISIVDLISEEGLGSFHLEETPIIPEVPVRGVHRADNSQGEIAHLIRDSIRALGRVCAKDNHKNGEEILQGVVGVGPDKQVGEYESLHSGRIRVLSFDALLRNHP